MTLGTHTKKELTPSKEAFVVAGNRFADRPPDCGGAETGMNSGGRQGVSDDHQRVTNFANSWPIRKEEEEGKERKRRRKEEEKEKGQRKRMVWESIGRVSPSAGRNNRKDSPSVAEEYSALAVGVAVRTLRRSSVTGAAGAGLLRIPGTTAVLHTAH